MAEEPVNMLPSLNVQVQSVTNVKTFQVCYVSVQMQFVALFVLSKKNDLNGVKFIIQFTALIAGFPHQTANFFHF